jgi:nucleoside-diphosphate-sugar epimerase
MGNIKTLSNASRSVSILGANGFIGSTIVRHLLRSSWKIEHDAPFEIDDLPNLKVPYTLINCVGTFSADEKIANRVNSKFPEALAKWASKVDTSLIHFGSSAEYKPKANLINENGATKESDLYSKTKLSGSKAVIEFGPKGKSIVLRPFGVVQNPLEPQPMNPSKLSLIITDARRKNFITIKNPKAIRDLVSVNDVAEATIKLLTASLPWPKILNICSGVGYSLTDIVRFVNPLIEILGQEESIHDIYVGDIALLNSFLGFSCEKNLRNVLFGADAENVKSENLFD